MCAGSVRLLKKISINLVTVDDQSQPDVTAVQKSSNTMAKSRFLFLFHLAAISVFIYGLYYDVNIIGWKVFEKAPRKPTLIPLKGRLMFLTIWNLVSYEESL